MASRKQISFDLSQEALKRHYPRRETAQDPQFFKRAYKDIQRFMDANGFDRRQYSVYVSRSELTALDVAVLTQQMSEQLPWLRQCVKDITAANIGARHIYGVPAATQRSDCGGERRRKVANAVFAAGGNGGERTLRRRGAAAPRRAAR